MSENDACEKLKSAQDGILELGKALTLSALSIGSRLPKVTLETVPQVLCTSY